MADETDSASSLPFRDWFPFNNRSESIQLLHDDSEGSSVESHEELKNNYFPEAESYWSPKKDSFEVEKQANNTSAITASSRSHLDLDDLGEKNSLSTIQEEEDLIYHEPIGFGASGKVHRVTWKSKTLGPIEAAAKVIQLHRDTSLYYKAQNEIHILRKLHHENIIHFYGHANAGMKLIIVMELASKGSLYDFLKLKSWLPFFKQTKWAIELARAIEYLKQCGILHKDVKSSNCLITAGDILKLCDFGIAKDLTSTTSEESGKGTLRWLAPEVISEGIISPKADIFSFGVVLWELHTCEDPYKGMLSEQIMYEVAMNDIRPSIPESCPTELKDLMQLCWDKDRNRRPSIEYVIEHLQAFESSLSVKFECGKIESPYYEQVRLQYPYRKTRETKGYSSISESELEYHELVGYGASAEVFRVTWKSAIHGPKEAAAKITLLNPYQSIDDDDAGRELALLRLLQHENIVTYYGQILTTSRRITVMEYASKGSLDKYLQSKEYLPLSLIQKWAKELALAIQYLKKNNVLHRDIKSSNCLITENDTLKLCDFGIAKDLTSTKTTNTEKGTIKWLAPEVFMAGKLSPKADIFSFGIVLWELLTCQEPYKGMRPERIMYEVAKNDLRPVIPKDCPHTLRFLMQECWHTDRDKRPVIEEILERLEAFIMRQIVIKESDLIYHEWLESGTFGESFRVTWKSNRNFSIPAVAKKVRRIYGCAAQGEIGNEYQLLERGLLYHENIVTYYGWTATPTHLVLVTEYAAKGSLYDYLKGRARPECSNIYAWANGLARALQYLKRHKVVHQDVSSHNCVITANDVLKLCNFDFAEIIQKTTYTESVKGSAKWMAPEVFIENKVSLKADIFSFGIVLWEMHTCEEPYKGMRSNYVMYQVGYRGLRPEIPYDCDPHFKDVMQQCWNKNPAKRPTIEDILFKIASDVP